MKELEELNKWKVKEEERKHLKSSLKREEKKKMMRNVELSNFLGLWSSLHGLKQLV